MFPIVKIDRTTAQDMLPVFINKGIFSNIKALPTKEELLESEKIKLGIESLTPEQERECLTDARNYKTKNYVIRDYGKYVIGFGLSFLMNDQELDSSLERVSLYKLGHRLAMIILAEAYQQRGFTNIVISKERILEYLGFSTNEKQIYRQIDNVIYSLMTLNYFINEYSEHFKSKVKSRQLGYFIYDVKSDQKSYTLSINENFMGCIRNVISDGNKKDKDFSRGYFDYPTSLLPISKNYTTPAYLLANLLVMDSGNAKLKKDGYKVVAYSVRHLLDKMKLNYKRTDHQIKAFLEALGEIEIISKTIPAIEELKDMNPVHMMDQVIHIYVKQDIGELDEFIKSNLLVTK